MTVDVELIWGSFYKADRAFYVDLALRAREALPPLFELIARHRIRATWAVVGHLFLERCVAVDGSRHATMPRPAHAWFRDDWYSADPATDERSDPAWYGRSLIERLLAIAPSQEIASHSFSHAIIGEARTSALLADAELAACVALARDLGLTLRSFVFPGNHVGHLERLPAHGFRVFRGRDPVWFNRLSSPWSKVGHFLDDVLAMAPPTVRPVEVCPGLWNLPGSMLYRSMEGPRRAIPLRSRVVKARRGIDRAIRRGEVFHLWFHDVDLVERGDRMLAGLDEILGAAAAARDRGDLRVVPMGEAVPGERRP
ncbi:MAG: hypothetical protein A3K11_10200 [Nitrospirae bacterium RIFCSPLOWO2_12_FULL_63_8]|nr:MAG: hypothetical protein A3K11_10200 [Nitrospirae bacterium RIFCSPLOWO2_12_FULL_63_8]